MKKIVLLISFMIITTNISYSKNIDKILSSLNVNKNAISIDIKSLKDGESVYSLNKNTPRLPASTLKIVTMSAVKDVLNDDYLFTTILYKSTNNDLYLKLSGDPFLETSDLNKLIETARIKNISPKNFYIDDTDFDKIEWGEGWQWDDELNPLMPKFSIYNINKNIINIGVMPSKDGLPPTISINPYYPLSIINNAKSIIKGATSIKLERDDAIAANMLSLTGNISTYNEIKIPVQSPKLFFRLTLEKAIKYKKLNYYSEIKLAQLPSINAYEVESIEHPISEMFPLVIKQSNNFIAESLFKKAGQVWSNNIGSQEKSIQMLENYLVKNNLNNKNIKIVDGSGVSKNNLVTANFMTDFLIFKSNNDFNEFYDLLTTPGEGTLSDRMLYFKDNLKAKTGTLSDSSAIAGYITTRKNNIYAFDIMINDPSSSKQEKKNIEEQVLRAIYEIY